MKKNILHMVICGNITDLTSISAVFYKLVKDEIISKKTADITISYASVATFDYFSNKQKLVCKLEGYPYSGFLKKIKEAFVESELFDTVLVSVVNDGKVCTRQS